MSAKQNDSVTHAAAPAGESEAAGNPSPAAVKERSERDQAIRIVYIRSIGHSGSTLLDMLLQSHDDVISVGEAKKLREKYDKKCTCPAGSMPACPFWSEVERHLIAQDGRRLNELDIQTDNPARFERDNIAFYRAVQAASGKQIIVDSSKSLSRLLKLLTVDEFDVRIIQLERHPFGVINSKVRKGRHLFATAKDVGRSMITSRLVLASHPRICVKYERFAQHPGRHLQKVMEYIGLEFQEQQLAWAGSERHNIGGNRMRRSTDSTIRLDTAWRRSLSLPSKLMLGIVLATVAALKPHQFIRALLTMRSPNCTTIKDVTS